MDPRKAVNLVDVVEQHEAKDVADAWHRLQQVQGMGVMVFGGFAAARLSDFLAFPRIVQGEPPLTAAMDLLDGHSLRMDVLPGGVVTITVLP